MIVFTNVSKTYPNGVQGLQNINLTIKEGEIVAIIGLSGAGKSTFLKSINRLVEISEGEIHINNQSITQAKKKKLRLIRRQIGLISQNFNLVKRSSVQKMFFLGVWAITLLGKVSLAYLLRMTIKKQRQL